MVTERNVRDLKFLNVILWWPNKNLSIYRQNLQASTALRSGSYAIVTLVLSTKVGPNWHRVDRIRETESIYLSTHTYIHQSVFKNIPSRFPLMHMVWKQQKPEGRRCSAWWKESKMINATCRRCFFAFISWISEVRSVNIQVWITTLYTCFQRFLLDGRQQTPAATRCTLCLGETTSPWTLCHSPSRLILSSPPPRHLAEIHKDLMYLQCVNSSASVWDDVNRRRRRKRSPERCDVCSPYETKTFPMFICVQTLGDLVLRATAPPQTDHGRIMMDEPQTSHLIAVCQA